MGYFLKLLSLLAHCLHVRRQSILCIDFVTFYFAELVYYFNYFFQCCDSLHIIVMLSVNNDSFSPFSSLVTFYILLFLRFFLARAFNTLPNSGDES